MNIREYLHLHEIDWFPIYIRIENSKKLAKRVEGYEDGEPWVDSWKPSKHHIEHMKTFDHVCNAIAIDTQNVHQLDVDMPSVFSMIIQKSGPWYKSFTKKLPHAFYTSVVPPKEPIGKYKVPCIETLTGRWAFAPSDAIVYNFDIKIPVYE
jgi:hypothetical protein